MLEATIVHSISDSDGASDTNPLPSPLASDAGTLTGDDEPRSLPTSARLIRPRLHSRQSSRTMIVSRDSTLTVLEDDMDEDDVRNMSPRRNSDELTRLTNDARRDLIEQAKVLQMSLQAIVDRVETVKIEHEKLEGGNKFLQSYIGELMQTSKITSTSLSKSKGKTRGGK